MTKSTKNKIIILLIIAALLASGLFYFWNKYIKQAAPAPIATEPSSETSYFGGGDTRTESGPDTDNQGSAENKEGVPILRQISDKPVAGGIAFNNGSSTYIRYVERGTGHIVETDADSFESAKISNTTIPKVPQAIWSPAGQTVVIRYLKDGANKISSFSANIIKATTTQDVSKNPKSAFLPSNINQLTINPAGDKIFYLRNQESESVGVISNIDGSKKNSLFRSAVTEWIVSWPNKEIIALTTKPSFAAAGYLFFLNSKTGGANKILSGINGLTALVDNATKNILYSESIDDSIRLNYYDLKSNLSKTLSFKTLPEKCVWSKTEEFIAYCAVPKTIEEGEYPDNWYQGLVSFNDSVWRVNAKTNSSELVFDFRKESSNEFDVTDPFLSGDDEYLFFTNKKDLTFWSLDLKKQQLNRKQLKNSTYF